MSGRHSEPKSRLVYASDLGRLCPVCREPLPACGCSRAKQRAPGDGVVRVRRETKGRGGKQVTVVTGVPLDDGELERLGKRLKRLCGSGGTVRGGVIELQGDHRDRVIAELESSGWTVKRAGG